MTDSQINFMKKIAFTFLCIAFFEVAVLAQSLKDAIKQTTNEQFETADASFKAIIQREPSNGENYFYYGENYFKNDNMEMAKAMYQTGIDVNATHPLCYVGLGKILWYNKNEQEAKTNFYKATTLSGSKNGTVLMEIAEVYINAENKNIPEAMNLLNQAAKLEPKNAEVYILMGDAFLEQQNGGEAIKNYEKATELNKASAAATLRIGKLYSRAKNYNLALDFYKKAIEIDASFAPAYREKAEIYYRAGRYQDAVAEYKKFLELNNNLSAKIRYTGFLYQAKQYKDAITQGSEVFNKDSGNIYLYRYLGYSYYENAEYPKGLSKMESFFSKAGKELKIIQQDYEYYGKLLAKNGKDSLGLIALTKAADMDTSKKDLYSDIGAAYFKMKKYPELINSYNTKIAASVKPSANDYFGLGRAYYFSKDFVNADSAFAKVIRSSPDYPAGYLWRGRVNSQQDPKNEKMLAKPYYEMYMSKVKPEDAEKNKKDLVEANTFIGVYYMKNKDFSTAKTYFKKVIELDPSNENAKKFLASPEANK